MATIMCDLFCWFVLLVQICVYDQSCDTMFLWQYCWASCTEWEVLSVYQIIFTSVSLYQSKCGFVFNSLPLTDHSLSGSVIDIPQWMIPTDRFVSKLSHLQWIHQWLICLVCDFPWLFAAADESIYCKHVKCVHCEYCLQMHVINELSPFVI